MRELEPIAVYLAALKAELERDGTPSARLTDEVAQHLVESAAHIATRESCDEREAARRAIERFGSPALVAASVEQARARRGSSWAGSVAGVAALLAIALGALQWCRAISDCHDLDRLCLTLFTIDIIYFSALLFKRACSASQQSPLWRNIVLLHAIFALTMMLLTFGGAAKHAIATDHILKNTLLGGDPFGSLLYVLLAVESVNVLTLGRDRDEATVMA